MPFRITTLPRDGYLLFRISGDNTPETTRACIGAILAEAVARDARSIVIEENFEGPALDLLDLFRIASEESLRAKAVLERLAYADINPAHPQANVDFAEDVAVNRGLNVRTCRSTEEAERWMQAQLAADRDDPGRSRRDDTLRE
jgi:hypothetical protein